MILGCYRRNTQHPLPKSTQNQYFDFQIFHMTPGELKAGIQYVLVCMHRSTVLYQATSGWDMVYLMLVPVNSTWVSQCVQGHTSSAPHPNQMYIGTKMQFDVYILEHTVYQITAPQVTCGISENRKTGLGCFLAGDADSFAYSTPGSCPFAFRFSPRLVVCHIPIPTSLHEIWTPQWIAGQVRRSLSGTFPRSWRRTGPGHKGETNPQHIQFLSVSRI